MRSTSRIWLSVSTGMSTPGMKIAAEISALRFDARAISSSHTAGRSTGSRAASDVPSSPSRAAIAAAISLDREALAGRHPHEVGREDVRDRRLVGDRDDRDARA